ncbi:alpha-ketoacid dehydrogenase subunit beta [Nocardiopsis composta]|uniref:Pyruvate dehydrogenase E1 component beta subunit n=1 Tax=Nocardiopsis composta TaxID=157465 RepID=A0A7W8QK66_9ACTN|nr:transketolase C-terminal domain-containing protein [Nocardiopsis composta]MBB5431016.1 pyruvate dehydrogenase E1 component beta subunit [Nocardiopsis composta]
MREISYLKGVYEAQRAEMLRDDRVFLMGEDIEAGVFGSSAGLAEEFGRARVRNVPLSENGFLGAAAGAALAGMRPIVDMTIASFLYVGMDQLVSIIAKATYMYGGQARVPLVVRAAMFYGGSNAAQHSDRPHPMFMGVPGLKIIAPSDAYDAKGLLTTAIRDDDPVMCFEDATLWARKAPVPEEEYAIPLGRAAVKREGSDATVVAVAGCVPHALRAADALAGEGVSIEVVDPRSLVPLDTAAILESVAKTGRLVVADPAHRTCSAASEISATVAEEGFGDLRAPIVRVATPDVQIPFSPGLEQRLYPTGERIADAVRSTLGAVAAR